MKDIGIVSVRVGSSRLPKKCLLPFGDSNVLEHVIRRANHFGFEPIVYTTDLKEDDIIRDIAVKEGCRFFRGTEKDKLKGWLDTCYYYDIKQFHTIDADDLFFDGELGHKSIELLKSGYDIVYPSNNIFIGGVGYSIKTDIIKRACDIKKNDDTEMMWYFIEKVPNLKKIELLVSDCTKDVRLTLDYDEDYWLLATVLRILGKYASRDHIENLFVQNPKLRLVNAFRSAEWKQNQETKGLRAISQ